MLLDFDDVQRFINSPPGQLAAGGVLAGVVWKFFERIEALLTDQTKFEIAVWLVGVEDLDKTVRAWPATFLRAFNRLFGPRHFTFKCFFRSSIMSILGVALMFAVWGFRHPDQFISYCRYNRLPFLEFVPSIVAVSFIPDYMSLLKSRHILSSMLRGGWQRIVFLWVLDVLTSLILAIAGFLFYCYFIENPFWKADDLRLLHELPNLTASLGSAPLSATLYPAFFTSVWAILYGASGLAIIGSRRLSSWLSWLNRHLDIERKPLQSIGLVAGALIAVVYWVGAAAASLLHG